MRFDVITLFPDLFASFLAESLMAKALTKKIIQVLLINPRDFTHDRHRTADDRPYGGGPGMVLKPEPLAAAILSAGKGARRPYRIMLSPSGHRLNQELAAELAQKPRLLLLCGRYEGVDQRVVDRYIDEEISIGDYVVNGGEVPAMVIIEAVARLQPGFMGHDDSCREESHQPGSLLEYPQYTRPPLFEGLTVPEILLSGDHRRVAAWRSRAALARTLEQRPELLARSELTAEQSAALRCLNQEDEAGKRNQNSQTSCD